MVGAVDIGGTKVAVGVVDDQGKVLSARESPTGFDCDYARGLDVIACMLQDLTRMLGVEMSGIGIGSTGPVYPFTGEFGEVDFLPQWRGKKQVPSDLCDRRHRHWRRNHSGSQALSRRGWSAS